MESRVQMLVRRGLMLAMGLLCAWTTSGCATVHLLRLTSAQSVKPERIDAAGLSHDQVAIWYKASRSNHMSHAVEPVYRYALLDLAQSNRVGSLAVAFPLGSRPPTPARSTEPAFVNIPVLVDTAPESLAVALQTNQVVVVGADPARFAVCRRSVAGVVEEIPWRIPVSKENNDAQSELIRAGAVTVGIVADAVTLTVIVFCYLISGQP